MIKREIIKEIEKWLSEEKILVLKWPRQVWKTTIMKYLQDKLEEKWERTFYFSVDLELWNDIFSSSKKFINFIKNEIKDKKIYIFIDEFQYIKNSWLFLKWVFDDLKEKIQLIVSGSSSLEITKNSEFLTWRKINFDITWISFFEYINHFSKFSYKKYSLDEIYNNSFDISDLKLNLVNYLNYWNYPEVLLTKEKDKKEAIVQEIISTYISKDISWFMRVSEIWVFNNLLKILSFQTWNLVNKSELWNTLNLDYRKLDYFLDILVWTYVVDFVSPYFTNIRKEISKMQKCYFNNLSHINYFSWNYISNLDSLDWSFLENFVYNNLKEIYKSSGIYYYRTISKSEIDFIIKTRNSFIPIEVKYRNKTWNLPVAIKNFEKKYDVTKKIIITKEELSKNKDIYKIPFYLVPFLKELL